VTPGPVQAISVAKNIYEAPNGVDCGFNEKTCHVPDWNSCFKFQLKTSVSPKDRPVKCPDQNSNIKDADGKLPNSQTGTGRLPANVFRLANLTAV
jgi:hypothetical protein